MTKGKRLKPTFNNEPIDEVMAQITAMVNDIELNERKKAARNETQRIKRKNKLGSKANDAIDEIYTKACFLGDELLEDLKKSR